MQIYCLLSIILFIIFLFITQYNVSIYYYIMLLLIIIVLSFGNFIENMTNNMNDNIYIYEDVNKYINNINTINKKNIYLTSKNSQISDNLNNNVSTFDINNKLKNNYNKEYLILINQSNNIDYEIHRAQAQQLGYTIIYNLMEKKRNIMNDLSNFKKKMNMVNKKLTQNISKVFLDNYITTQIDNSYSINTRDIIKNNLKIGGSNLKFQNFLKKNTNKYYQGIF